MQQQLSLRQMQQTFASHLRSPGDNPAPTGVAERGLQVYRSLIFGNLEGLLAGQFPVAKATLGNEFWEKLVRHFLRNSRSMNPYFTALAQDFINFVTACDSVVVPPYLVELLSYEHEETKLLYTDEDNATPAKAFSDPIRLASHTSLSVYQFPVHQIAPGFIAEKNESEPTRILAYRNRSGSIQFNLLPELPYHLLSLIQQNPGYELSEWMRSISEINSTPEFVAQCGDFLGNLIDGGLLVRTEPNLNKENIGVSS